MHRHADWSKMELLATAAVFENPLDYFIKKCEIFLSWLEIVIETAKKSLLLFIFISTFFYASSALSNDFSVKSRKM